ncbi:uncharacterized protein HGUI_00920 [Hanseniaspora guilliermondii]|uniref:Pre-mRNA-splicing factor CWC24 n=1 Tax=Hanseniaspora guilliermondii TaxID=56406 RepID=A0A1L0AXB4_9ASCO|nr:uncharacterized protein HGUI_00920 [Hanseniaspora guilliermondii]
MFQKKRVNKLKLVDVSEDKAKKDNKNKKKLDLAINNRSKNVTIKPPTRSDIANNKKIYMDYEPLLCKEYKLKGYCGYGDTCKFIHSRDDYINENKLTKKHWKNSQESKEEERKVDVVIKKSDLCGVCKVPFDSDSTKKLIQLVCKHVFCKSCFMERLKNKKMECPECGSDSKGSMKPYRFA